MNVRALSQPSVDHLLPYFGGVCEQFDASVILTLVNVTIFFENGDQNAVSSGRWYALSGHDSVENLQSVTTPNCPRHFHTSTGISSLPTALPHVIPLSALAVSASLAGIVMPWLGALSSVSIRGFSSFMSQLKYWPNRSLMYSYSLAPLLLHFDGSNLSNVLPCSDPNRCDYVDVFLPFTR